MNQSSENYDTQSSIFMYTKEMMLHDLKQQNKRVKTARVIFLVAASILLLSSLFLFDAAMVGLAAEDWSLAIAPATGVLFLVFALLSFRNPFAFLLVPTVVWSLGVLINLYQELVLSSPEITMIGRLAVQLVITLYLVRGVIAARKAQQLKEAIAGQS